ncbi:unnamed protein product [Phaedon cochleariae]|uniref:Carboxylic ester hydrolase n=1 Tax=Phaedon cochleariae TaxID=80249 RepID=A0A9P0DUJ6_PHACE|nr:unnamed protein product [Phaedon cochleariae]
MNEKMQKVIASLIFLWYLTLTNAKSTPVVTLPDGRIRGEILDTYKQKLPFYAFLGIPYAAPPIGKNRFQPPKPVQKWSGILIMTSNPKICYQTGLEDALASEDCLYLNVYSPVVPGSNASLPVMVFIHGGTFIRGSAPSGFYGPQFIIEQNVIVVTINYRLGPFGFLSTGDKVMPGNMGLKDQQFALKWVQQNIHLFGGDPKKVIVMGQSAGSASVTYHLISKSSAGLFRGAIGLSGSALNTWAHDPNAVNKTYGIAAEIDPSFSRNRTTQELMDFLQSVDGKLIHATGTNSKYSSFAPVIEVEHDGAMITESMYMSVKEGRINRVPYLAGICSEEAILMAAKEESWEKTASAYDKDLRKLVDPDMYITDATILEKTSAEIKAIYTNDTLRQDIGAFTQYFGDNRYMRAPIKYAKLHSQYADVYFYQFSYHGIMGNNNFTIDGIGRVGHAEDLRYLWSNYKSYESFPESDMRTLDRYVGLLTNFAKFLNPTPENSELFGNNIWPKVTSEHYRYLDIDRNITIQENPRKFSYGKWEDIFEKYATKPLISF